MAALMFVVPAETARILHELDVPGERAPDSHVTVVHLGDDVPVVQLAKLMPVLYEVTAQTMPFSVSTHHITTFPGGVDGVPVIAKVQSPELHTMHDDLCAALDEISFEYDTRFPEYVPHVTLAYAPQDEADEIELDIPPLSWPAHELLLWGSNRGTGRLVVKFPLSLPMGKVARHQTLSRAMVQLAQWSRHSLV